MKRKFYFIILIAICIFSFASETERPKSVLAVDLGWSTEGLSNEGYGFGISFEQELFSFLSFKLRHGVVETYKNAVGNRVDSYIYSFVLSYNVFNKGLDGPSLMLGFGYDNVLASDPETGETKYNFLLPFLDTLISYKLIFFDKIFVEPYLEFMWALGDVQRKKTGIAMDTTYVNIIGLNLGVAF